MWQIYISSFFHESLYIVVDDLPSTLKTGVFMHDSVMEHVKLGLYYQSVTNNIVTSENYLI